MTIQQYLKKYRLITDGSFGTYYANRYDTQEMPELANLLDPERVLAIHTAYLQAGANLLRTNTFAANTALLHTSFEGVAQNIRAAAALARQAVAQERTHSTAPVFLAGDIGPIPREVQEDTRMLEEEYERIICLFREEGIKILTFETFDDLTVLLPVLRRIRAQEQDKQEEPLFLMIQFCVNQYGYSNAGLSAAKLVKEAAQSGLFDAIGFNCGVGPAHMEQILANVQDRIGELLHQHYLVTLPNAGYPERVRNQLQYANNPDYFAHKMQDMADRYDVAVLGGCCGTTPDFIADLSGQPDIRQKAQAHIRILPKQVSQQPQKTGFFYEKGEDKSGKKLIAVELAPPADADDERLLEAAHRLKHAGVDILTFPDSPSGRTRIDSVLMAEKVKRETGMQVMPHLCCRDKNAIAMRSLLLGAHINDIYHFLIVTGDPIPSMARGGVGQDAKAVFNFDAVGLMRLVKDMNEESFVQRPMTYGGAINQGRRNLDVEIRRVQAKMEAGAAFFLTQPVFSIESAQRIARIKQETGARILCGIMPFVSRKNALFMKNEIAGIDVSDEWIARYPEHASRQEAEAIGVELAKEVMRYTEDFADGYYFSFPFNRVSMLEQIL